MKKNNTNLILVISIILFTLFIGTFVYLLSVIKNKNVHTGVVVATLGEKILEKENIGVIEKRMVELLATQTKLGGYLVDTSHIDDFVEYLENIGTQNNVELSVNSVNIPKNEKNKVLVNISIIGSFSNVMKTIAIVENASYSININSLYLNKEITTVNDTMTEIVKGKEKVTPITKASWQADISFKVLSL